MIDVVRVAAALGCLLATSGVLRAESCAPPNVGRAVLIMDRADPKKLECPHEGLCYFLDTLADAPLVIWVVCLTPQEETEAIERGDKRR